MSPDRPTDGAMRRSFRLMAEAARLSEKAWRTRTEAFQLRGYDPSMAETATRLADTYAAERVALTEMAESYTS